MAVRGEQHYCELFKDWWCVAGPIRDPSGTALGYLDISLHAEEELGLAGAHLKIILAVIERELISLNLEQLSDEVNSLLQAMSKHAGGKLSLRQTEVLRLKLSGHKHKDIAEKLSLSVLTVDSHCKNIYSNCGVGNFEEFLERFPVLGLYYHLQCSLRYRDRKQSDFR